MRVYVAPVQIDGAGLSAFDGVVQYGLRLGTVERLMRSDLNVLQAINGFSLWQNEDISVADQAVDYRLFLTLSPRASIDSVKPDLANQASSYRLDAIVISSSGDEFNRETFHSATLGPKDLSKLSEQVAHWSGSLFGMQNLPKQTTAENGSPEYFDAMIRARRAFNISNIESLVTSTNWFDRAIAIQPEATEALGGKAMALAVIAGSSGYPASVTYQQAMAIAANLRETTGPTAQSELARGFIYLYRNWDLVRARQAFDLEVTLVPGDATAHAWRAAALAAQGDTTEAAAEADLAVRLDPLSMVMNSDRCWYLGVAGCYREAVTACEYALSIDVSSYWSRIGLVGALEKQGKEKEALAVLMPILTSFRDAEQV